MRDGKKGSIQYPYYGYLVCPTCGEPLVSICLPLQTTPKCWICPGKKEGVKRKKRSDCEAFAFHEKVLNEAVGRAILGLDSMDGVPKKELESIQKAVKETGSIERYFLKALVEKITFPDFEHLTVYWKNGRKKTVPLKIVGYYTHPYPEVGKKENGFVEYGGEQIPIGRLEKVQNAMETRKRHIQNVEITMPDAESPIQIPIVRKGK